MKEEERKRINNMEEIWKDIEGYENKYQVSTEGNVRSLNYNNTGKPQKLKVKINKYGFVEVKLSKNNKTKDFMVARLVAQAFIPNNANKPLVTHKDNNKLNNRATNLKWVYDSESKFLMYFNGNRIIGKSSGNKISYRGKPYKNYSALAKDYNMTPRQLIRRINRGWTLQEAIGIKVDINNCGGKPLYYKYNGRELTLEQISEITGISKKVISKRLSRKWGIEEAAEIPVGRRKQ